MYFPNGTSGLDFQSRYCDRCANNVDKNDGRGPGCPVFDVHFLHNGDQFKNEAVKSILDTLIPGECAMFLDRGTPLRLVDMKRCRRNGCYNAASETRDGYCKECS